MNRTKVPHKPLHTLQKLSSKDVVPATYHLQVPSQAHRTISKQLPRSVVSKSEDFVLSKVPTNYSGKPHYSEGESVNSDGFESDLPSRPGSNVRFSEDLVTYEPASSDNRAESEVGDSYSDDFDTVHGLHDKENDQSASIPDDSYTDDFESETSVPGKHKDAECSMDCVSVDENSEHYSLDTFESSTEVTHPYTNVTLSNNTLHPDKSTSDEDQSGPSTTSDSSYDTVLSTRRSDAMYSMTTASSRRVYDVTGDADCSLTYSYTPTGSGKDNTSYQSTNTLSERSLTPSSENEDEINYLDGEETLAKGEFLSLLLEKLHKPKVTPRSHTRGDAEHPLKQNARIGKTSSAEAVSFCSNAIHRLLKNPTQEVERNDKLKPSVKEAITGLHSTDNVEEMGISSSAITQLKMANTLMKLDQIANMDVHEVERCNFCKDNCADVAQRSFIQSKRAIVTEKTLCSKLEWHTIWTHDPIALQGEALREMPRITDEPQQIMNQLLRPLYDHQKLSSPLHQ